MNPAPVEADKEPITNLVWDIRGGRLKQMEAERAIQALVDKAVVAELESLYALPNIQYQDPHVQAIYKSAIKDRLNQLKDGAKDE